MVKLSQNGLALHVKGMVVMDPRSLHRISYGLYVVSSRSGDRLNGQIANAIFQVTSDPKVLAISINRENLTHSFIEESGVFTVNALSENTPIEFIRKFGFNSGRDMDKFEGVEHKLGETGSPVILENSIAFMEARVTDRMDVGTHTVFVGRIEDAAVLSDDTPMTYDYYRLKKGGKSPKNAPTYYREEEENELHRSGTYECRICGYIYDPVKGIPEQGIAAGTPFEDLPGDWRCPGCGASKRIFVKLA